jgi:hypothetical protein
MKKTILSLAIVSMINEINAEGVSNNLRLISKKNAQTKSAPKKSSDS